MFEKIIESHVAVLESISNGEDSAPAQKLFNEVVKEAKVDFDGQLSAKEEDFKAQLELQNEKIESLQSDLSEKENEITTLKQKNDELSAENADLLDENGELDEENEMLSEANSQLSKMTEGELVEVNTSVPEENIDPNADANLSDQDKGLRKWKALTSRFQDPEKN